MVNNFICRTCSWPNLPYLTFPYLTLPNLTPNLTAIHVHHFLYYKLCRAVDILQNLCRPVAIRAVNIFLSKSETAQNTRTADDFWCSTSFHFFCQLVNLRRLVDIFVSTSFFELSNFEQLIISRWKYRGLRPNSFKRGVVGVVRKSRGSLFFPVL